MKTVTGITRVTLKKRDGLIFVINDPEVFKSATNENSFAIFGELKLEDPNSKMTQNEAKKFGEKEPHQHDENCDHSKEENKVESAKVEEDPNEEPLPEEGLTPNHIDLVIQHSGCTRNTAIRALRESNDDMVNAIMSLTK